MRATQSTQLQFGAVDISKIQINPKSRDDIPQLLRGLQHLYINQTTREALFKLLEENIAPEVDKKNGRPGMDLWKIFVLGVLRLNLNCDFDRIEELGNSHREIRQMLGHSDLSDTTKYHLQTLKDNVSLLTPELLDKINQVVVTAGHALVAKKKRKNGATWTLRQLCG